MIRGQEVGHGPVQVANAVVFVPDDLAQLLIGVDLLSQHESTSHPDVIDQWMALADLMGKHGNPRAAIALYDELVKELAEQLGPHDARLLDAYEGIARWVGAQGRA
ncbi:hypothetical protein OG883_43090 [Streptomyces sp. NBC_01142]|uniref:hypothetical protein n=1 Tax=Streptomyces sp. NBC_01142 TaxID=2975865 RepID=UPI00225A1CA4|nr:hypothetical protein [Streptomyces sp. NBC_01142]MCX4826428.1 hypothetical protein [Streptomyces sp. NBC_01142]